MVDNMFPHATMKKFGVRTAVVICVFGALLACSALYFFDVPLFSEKSLNQTSVNLQDKAEGEEYFKKVKDEVFSITEYEFVQETIAQYETALEHAPGCLRIGAEWVFGSKDNLNEILGAYDKSEIFATWKYYKTSTGRDNYMSNDTRVLIRISIDRNEDNDLPSIKRYRINILYHNPSYSACVG